MFSSSKVLVVAGLGAIVSGNKVNLGELPNYSFEKFVQDFKHPWQPNSKEYELRQSIFESELKNVLSHNSENKDWKMTVNKYSAFTSGEKRTMNGYSKSVARAHEPKNLKELPHDFVMKDVSQLPESVDWRDSDVVTSVKDQGHCGSCWSFAATATLESHLALNSGLLYDLSPQQIAMCAPNPDSCGGTGGCQGATAEIAFDYVAGAGVLEEYQLGYQAYYGENSACGMTRSMVPVATTTGFVKLAENNYNALMNAVAQIGPMAVSVDASTWHNYESGIYSGCNQESPVINHAVVLVGYGVENGTKYWTVRNSWSPSWGENGYIRLLRTDKDEEVCGMDVSPQDGTACAGDDTPVKVCGTCGILYDSSYPTGATH
jgi:cathepsin L